MVNGRVAYMPADIDARFGRENLPDHGDLLAAESPERLGHLGTDRSERVGIEVEDAQCVIRQLFIDHFEIEIDIGGKTPRILRGHDNATRALEKTDKGIQSRLHFSSASEAAFTKVREGHVTDVSATLFISAPEDYDGGELTVEDTYGSHAVKLPAGDMIVAEALQAFGQGGRALQEVGDELGIGLRDQAMALAEQAGIDEEFYNFCKTEAQNNVDFIADLGDMASDMITDGISQSISQQQLEGVQAESCKQAWIDVMAEAGVVYVDPEGGTGAASSAASPEASAQASPAAS